MEVKQELYLGDCKDILKKNISDNCVDLIFTSPPYANQRKGTYGGIPADEYIEWFLNISIELKRVLKPTGSFVLNIKEHIHKRERSTYVLELIIALRKQGWLWTDEFIWHKTNPMPGKWSNRLKDGWERLLHFNKDYQFNMYHDAVLIPVDKVIKPPKKYNPENDIRKKSNTGSGFNYKNSNFYNREMKLPSNVLSLPIESKNKNHSAVFPESLPEWFIKLFTQKGDTVLDPFMGSGTTCQVAKRMKRNCIGIEILEEYYNMVVENMKTPDIILL